MPLLSCHVTFQLASMSTWTINKFFLQINDPDPDYNVIALNEFVEHLSSLKNSLLDLQVDQINSMLLPKIISRFSDNTPDTVNPSFRSIVLMSQTLPIQCLSTLFKLILDEVYMSDCEIRPQILSILREILTNSVSYEPDRQKAICEALLPRLDGEIKQARQDEFLLFSLNLLTFLVEALAFQLDVEEKEKVYEVLKVFAPTSNGEVLQSVAALAKFWAVSATNEQFEALMRLLFEMENRGNAFTMLCAMVKFKPIVYEKYAKELLEMFLLQIDQEEVDAAALMENEPETDLFADTDYIRHISELLSSVGALVHTFPEDGKLYLERILGLVFVYMTCGSSAQLDEGEDDGSNDVNNDFEVEVMPDDEDDIVTPGDDSWQIRKTVIGLAMILIDCYHDDFYAALSYTDEETNRMAMVTMLITDNDVGAQKDAFELVRKIVHDYRVWVSDEQVQTWFVMLAKQISSDKQEILKLLLSTITAIMNDVASIPFDAVMIAVNRILTALNPAVVPYVLSFLRTVLKACPGKHELIEPICKIFIAILQQGKSKTILPCLEVISQFYVFLQGSTDSPIVDELNKLVIGLSEKKGEKKTAAISTLAIFVICCAGYESLETSLQVIIECRKSEACHKVLCGSVALIIATGHADLLAPYTSLLFETLGKNVNNIDLTVQYRALWALRMMLEQKLIEPASCSAVVPSLVEILTRGDHRCKLLALIILGMLPNTAAASLDAICLCLTGPAGQVTDEIVDEICKLMMTFATYALDNVITALNKLFEQGLTKKKDSAEMANIAKLIGYVSGHVKEYEQDRLARFRSGIVGCDKPEPISLLCTGELGSYVDLSQNTDLVDAIFNLALSSDRPIFTAAANCVGGMASGSAQVIMPRLVKHANEDTNSFTKWLIALLALTKKIVKSGKAFDDQAFTEVSECVLANANSVKEARQSVAECLALLGKMRPEFVNRLIELATPQEKGSIAMRAVSMYIEGAGVDETMRLIDPIMGKIDADQPEISEFVMQALKSALRYNTLTQTLATYLPTVCDCVEERPSHIKEISYGLEQTQNDIGYQFRLLAIECVLTFFREVPSMCNPAHLLKVVELALAESKLGDSKERRYDITDRGLTLLAEMSVSPVTGSETVDALPTLAPLLAALYRQMPWNEIESPFLRMLVYVSHASEKKKNNEFEQLYLHVKSKHDAPMEKLRVDLSYVIGSQTTAFHFISSSVPTSAEYDLMHAHRPEAATMFSQR